MFKKYKKAIIAGIVTLLLVPGPKVALIAMVIAWLSTKGITF